MKLSEAKSILINRVGWRDDKTVNGLVLSTDNLETTSGLFFQDEHSAVTLRNIRDCQPIVNIAEDDFQDYLEVLKAQSVQQVLNDAFERDYIDDDLLGKYPHAFDKAISLRMVIVVSELIMTSSRINRNERYGDEFVGKLNYDVFRDAPNKFAIRGANYNYSLGIATRYRFEIQSLQRKFGSQRNLLKTITKGQSFRYDIDEQHDFDNNRY
jgi:hypothetical protein